MSLASEAYDKVKFRGAYVNKRMRLALEQVEEILGYELTIIQGGYSYGSLSAGTHTYGNAADLSAYDWQRKVRALVSKGFAAWYRPYNWDGKGGGAHIHCLLLFDREAEGLALAQMKGFLRGRNGLGSPPDFSAPSAKISQPPSPVVHFSYVKEMQAKRRKGRVVKNLGVAIRRLQIVVRNSDTAKERAAYRAYIRNLKRLQRQAKKA